MDVLIRYGFTIEEIKNMMDTNEAIASVSDKDIYELIDILVKVGCVENHIKNIFLCNPFYLTRNVNDINNLIKKLYEIGFRFLFVLFDMNPYLLNMRDVEVQGLYQSMRDEGLTKEEVIDFISNNMILG